LRKKPPNLRRKRVQIDKNTANVPPIGAPSWCLNEEALRKFNRPTDDIPTYDGDTEDDSENDTSSEDENREIIRRRKPTIMKVERTKKEKKERRVRNKKEKDQKDQKTKNNLVKIFHYHNK
jgi:hypothetical protein